MPYDARLKTPANFIISGGSKTGKTTFVYNLLKLRHEHFEVVPSYIILFYTMYQDAYDELLKSKDIQEVIDIGKTSLDINELTPKLEFDKSEWFSHYI